MIFFKISDKRLYRGSTEGETLLVSNIVSNQCSVRAKVIVIICKLGEKKQSVSSRSCSRITTDKHFWSIQTRKTFTRSEKFKHPQGHTHIWRKKTGARLRCRGGKSPAEAGRERDSQQKNVNKADQELGDGYALDLCVLTPRRWCELVGGGFASTGSREPTWPSACRQGNRSGRRVRTLLRRGDPTGCRGSCRRSAAEEKRSHKRP